MLWIEKLLPVIINIRIDWRNIKLIKALPVANVIFFSENILNPHLESSLVWVPHSPLCKKCNLIYSGHALSYTSTELSQFTGMSLKQRKQIFQINITLLKIPTGRRQTSWLFTKCEPGFELGTTEKQIPLMAGWRPWTRDLRITTPAP